MVCVNYVVVGITERCASTKGSSNARNSQYWKNLFLGDTEHVIFQCWHVIFQCWHGDTRHTNYKDGALWHCDGLYPVLENIPLSIVEIARLNDGWTGLKIKLCCCVLSMYLMSAKLHIQVMLYSSYVLWNESVGTHEISHNRCAPSLCTHAL